MNKSNAARFIACESAILKRYEDELLDFGRLRNSIVHRSDVNRVIAEPHDKVVDIFEYIAKIISTSPMASSVATPASSIDAGSLLKDALLFMTTHNFSNMPVTINNNIIGVLNNKHIVEYVSTHIENLDRAFKVATVRDAMGEGTHYSILA